MNTNRSWLSAVFCSAVLCWAVPVPGYAIPVALPTYDTSTTGIVLLDAHGQGSEPGTSAVQVLPTGIDGTFAPAFRQYFSLDPCFLARAGSAMGCPFVDLLNDAGMLQHWELEIYNPGPFTAFNIVDATTGFGAASGQVGLSTGTTLHIDLLVDDTFAETGSKAFWLVSDPIGPLGFTFSVVEGGTATAATPTLVPCPLVVTGTPCLFNFISDPQDFYIVELDPLLPTIWINRPEDRHLFPSPIPEPATAILVLSGLTLALRRRVSLLPFSHPHEHTERTRSEPQQ